MQTFIHAYNFRVELNKFTLPPSTVWREARWSKAVHDKEDLSAETLPESKVGATPTNLCAVIFVSSGVGILLKSMLDPLVWYNVRASWLPLQRRKKNENSEPYRLYIFPTCYVVSHLFICSYSRAVSVYVFINGLVSKNSDLVHHRMNDVPEA